MKFFKFSTRCGQYFKQSYAAQICFTRIRFLTPSDIYRLVAPHDVFKFQSRVLEVFRSWGHRITGGVSDRSPHALGSKGKAQVWGSGGLRMPEAVDLCSHAFKI